MQVLHEQGVVAGAVPAVGGVAVGGAVGVHVRAAQPPLGERDVPGDRAAVAGRLVRAADDADDFGGLGGLGAAHGRLFARASGDGRVGASRSRSERAGIVARYRPPASSQPSDR